MEREDLLKVSSFYMCLPDGPLSMISGAIPAHKTTLDNFVCSCYVHSNSSYVRATHLSATRVHTMPSNLTFRKLSNSEQFANSEHTNFEHTNSAHTKFWEAPICTKFSYVRAQYIGISGKVWGAPGGRGAWVGGCFGLGSTPSKNFKILKF